MQTLGFIIGAILFVAGLCFLGWAMVDESD